MTQNPYEELASLGGPDAPHGDGTGPPPAPNPYDALGAGPDADGGPRDNPYDNPYDHPREDGPLGFTLRSDYDEPAYHDPVPAMRALRRRRRSRLRMAVRLGVGLVVLGAFLVVADRWAALYASNEAAKKVQDSLKLHAEPEVHIRGFPFLTQLASDRLDQVDVAIPDMPAGRVSVAQVKGSVRDVHIVGSAPSSIKGAVLGEMRGEVLLDFDDLDRELGTSQVKFTHAGARTVRARGQLPVGGEQVRVSARAQVERTGDHGVGTTVDRMRLDVPDRFSFTPGDEGGLRLARPAAQRVRDDTATAKALFRIGTVAKRFGLSADQAERVRGSDPYLREITGDAGFTEQLMDVNMLDVLAEHPWLLKRFGIDPALLAGLKKVEEPKLAQQLSLSVRLPDLPGDVRLRDIQVAPDGIRAKLSGTDIPFGGGARGK